MKNHRTRWLLPLAMLMLSVGTLAAHAQVYTVLYNFGVSAHDIPAHPSYSGIVAQGRDGNLYSSTCGSSYGAAYSITPNGAFSAFPFGQDEECPEGGLALGSDGNFYGTSRRNRGGFTGTIFKMTPSGSLTQLHQFVPEGDGATPYAPPIQGADGNFYGTTSHGGDLSCNAPNGCGSVYKTTPSGIVTTLFLFDNTHGAYPYAPLVQGLDGSFFGTAYGGGTNGQGVIFKITPTGKLTVLYNFDCAHGNGSTAPLIQASDGNFYGTTSAGGKGCSDPGVVFRMTPAGKITVLHTLHRHSDGSLPFAGLVEATDGNFYGVASAGGSDVVGTIFKITPHGNFSTLYNFDWTSGAHPQTTLIQSTNGLLYGTTADGGTGQALCGSEGCGVFFSLDVGLAPFIRLVNTTAKVGGTVEILGQGFTGTTAVALNGAAASFSVVSDTYLTITVPYDATTGVVTVTTPGGTLTSNKQLRVKP